MEMRTKDWLDSRFIKRILARFPIGRFQLLKFSKWHQPCLRFSMTVLFINSNTGIYMSLLLILVLKGSNFLLDHAWNIWPLPSPILYTFSLHPASWRKLLANFDSYMIKVRWFWWSETIFSKTQLSTCLRLASGNSSCLSKR